MANKAEVIAQEKMNAVALKFFRPERPAIDTPAGAIINKAYRQWIYFITAKQVNWLLSVGAESSNIFPEPHGKRGAMGSFVFEGKEYGWQIHTIKGGAAQYKVTLILE